MSALITGVISGVVASAMFYVFLLLVRPKIHISDKICYSYENGVLIFRIKVVNKTRAILFNVNYSLNFCENLDEGVYINQKNILPIKKPITIIAKYDKKDKNSEYAVRLTFPGMCISDTDDQWFEFSVSVSHGFSNTSVCMKKTYRFKDILPGIFEKGTSMNITKLNLPPISNQP